jgi:hypothetical protein
VRGDPTTSMAEVGQPSLPTAPVSSPEIGRHAGVQWNDWLDAATVPATPSRVREQANSPAAVSNSTPVSTTRVMHEGKAPARLSAGGESQEIAQASRIPAWTVSQWGTTSSGRGGGSLGGASWKANNGSTGLCVS